MHDDDSATATGVCGILSHLLSDHNSWAGHYVTIIGWGDPIGLRERGSESEKEKEKEGRKERERERENLISMG